MKIQKLTFLFFFTVAVYTANAQCTIPPASGDPCLKLTQEKMRIYENQLKELLRLGELDKNRYGTSGAYAAAAVNFHDYAKNAVDTARRMVDWLATGGDGNPAVTITAEASWIQGWIENIMNNLKSAHWQISISAIYNRSIHAACAREKCLQLMAEALNIYTYSSRCYIRDYRDIPACK